MAPTAASLFPQPAVAPEPALAVLERHGRSFHFAGRFLGRKHLTRAARLYAFCRHVDDLVDVCADSLAAHWHLDNIEADVTAGASSDPTVRDFIELAEECSIDLDAARQLIIGVRSDLGAVQMRCADDLIRYCYRVAGTVGLMMCDVLEATDQRARPHAIDLGIAMQLTNIARDVMEDARSGRRYLPADLVGHAEARTIATDAMSVSRQLQQAIVWVLTLAERYYESGESGLPFLPPRPRLAILIAARVYRAIGHELARRDHAPWVGRAVVPTHRKLTRTVGAFFDMMRRADLRQMGAAHDVTLHVALAGLPGIHTVTDQSCQYVPEPLHG